MDLWNSRLQLANNNLLISALLLKLKQNGNNKRRHRHWVCPYLKDRNSKGRYAKDFANLMKSPEVFIEKFHMSLNTFLELYSMLEEHLLPVRSTRPDAIPPLAKFAVVLEFFACGNDQQIVTSSYRISKQHMGRIIDGVCAAIGIVLKDEISEWQSNTMLRYAEEFEEKYTFPNCIGAIGGKHIAVRAPTESGSVFYNYNSFQSIVFMAICDASYKFTYVDIGTCGSKDDGNIFANLDFGVEVLADCLDFPDDKNINGMQIPYFIVGNDRFPLHKRLMTPYTSKTFPSSVRVFNDRLSQVSQCFENTFDLLNLQWRCLQTLNLCKPERAQKIVKTCCLLQNYMLRVCKSDYVEDFELGKQIDMGDIDIQKYEGQSSEYAKIIRDKLRTYLCSDKV